MAMASGTPCAFSAPSFASADSAHDPVEDCVNADSSDSTIHAGFVASAHATPDAIALDFGDRHVTYAQLLEAAKGVARTITALRTPHDTPFVGVLGQRSLTTYAGMLGASMAGVGYIPLHPDFPWSRSADPLDRTGTSIVICDEAGLRHASNMRASTAPPQTVIHLGGPETTAQLDNVGIRWRDASTASAEWPLAHVDPSADAIAFLPFTSGSTGRPKGVLVRHGNICAFKDAMRARFAPTSSDRFSQLFDTTFDPSLFDCFVAWDAGATVCVPRPDEMLRIEQYAIDRQLTIWFSVPSVGLLLQRRRVLTSGCFPNLRLALFAGEALPTKLAISFADAAPHAHVENLYGPTELTVVCTGYRWSRDEDNPHRDEATVPIGWPMGAMHVRVTDASGVPVADGVVGELELTGPQVTAGYFDDPDKTAAAFVEDELTQKTFYRTGDRARRDASTGCIYFLGRNDAQVQVRGYRVELGDVEAAVCDELGCERVVALGWPETLAGADGIVVFTDIPIEDPTPHLQGLRSRLPHYMVPRRLVSLEAFPLSANGKIDRHALRASLDA